MTGADLTVDNTVIKKKKLAKDTGFFLLLAHFGEL